VVDKPLVNRCCLSLLSHPCHDKSIVISTLISRVSSSSSSSSVVIIIISSNRAGTELDLSQVSRCGSPSPLAMIHTGDAPIVQFSLRPPHGWVRRVRDAGNCEGRRCEYCSHVAKAVGLYCCIVFAQPHELSFPQQEIGLWN